MIKASQCCLSDTNVATNVMNFTSPSHRSTPLPHHTLSQNPMKLRYSTSTHLVAIYVTEANICGNQIKIMRGPNFTQWRRRVLVADTRMNLEGSTALWAGHLVLMVVIHSSEGEHNRGKPIKLYLLFHVSQNQKKGHRETKEGLVSAVRPSFITRCSNFWLHYSTKDHV